MTDDTHIVKSYGEELQFLNDSIIQMGSLTESLLADSMNAITILDKDAVERIVQSDKKIKLVLSNKTKNIIQDNKIKDFIFRVQQLDGLPPKELRQIIDSGKKEIQEGIVLAISSYEEKLGIAIGVTSNLVNKFDAVALVKEASIILGGSGGGGRKDFAQSGGTDKSKINEAIDFIKSKIS